MNDQTPYLLVLRAEHMKEVNPKAAKRSGKAKVKGAASTSKVKASTSTSAEMDDDVDMLDEGE